MKKCGPGKTSSNESPFLDRIDRMIRIATAGIISFLNYPGACRQKNPAQRWSRCNAIGTYGKPLRTKNTLACFSPEGLPDGLLGDLQIM
jgi:hypothetical protein